MGNRQWIPPTLTRTWSPPRPRWAHPGIDVCLGPAGHTAARGQTCYWPSSHVRAGCMGFTASCAPPPAAQRAPRLPSNTGRRCSLSTSPSRTAEAVHDSPLWAHAQLLTHPAASWTRTPENTKHYCTPRTRARAQWRHVSRQTAQMSPLHLHTPRRAMVNIRGIRVGRTLHKHCARPFRHNSLVELNRLTSARLVAVDPQDSPGCGHVISGPQMIPGRRSLMFFIARCAWTSLLPRLSPARHPGAPRGSTKGTSPGNGVLLNLERHASRICGWQSVVSPAGPTSSAEYDIK